MSESSDRRLKGIIDRLCMIRDEQKNLRDEKGEVLAEAKAVGYDLATIRKVMARIDLSPAERGEADSLLETYEAALGGFAATVPLRASAADLAAALLAEQLEGIEDPAHAAALVEHVLALLDIRAEIAVLRLQERERKKLADGEGFEPKQIALVVRWYEKCVKWGADAMKAGEQVFRLYRATVDESGGAVRPQGEAPTADAKLAELFGKPAPKAPTRKQKAVSDAIALARLNQRGAG